MPPERKIRGYRWGGCIVNDGVPAIYVVVEDADGRDVMVFCRAELKDIEDTAPALRSAMA